MIIMATTPPQTHEQQLLQLNKPLLDRAAKIYNLFTEKNNQKDNFSNLREQFQQRNENSKLLKERPTNDDLNFIGQFMTMQSQFEKSKKETELLIDKIKLNPNFNEANKSDVITKIKNDSAQLAKVCKEVDEEIQDFLLKKLENSSKNIQKIIMQRDYERQLIDNPDLDKLKNIQEQYKKNDDKRFDIAGEVNTLKRRIDAIDQLLSMHDYVSVQNKINAKNQEIQNVKNDPDEIAELNNEIKGLESEKNKHKPDFDKLTKEKNDTQKQLIIVEQKQNENEKLLKSLAEKEEQLNAKNQAYNSNPDRIAEIAEKQKVSEERNNMKIKKLFEVENGSEQFNLLCNTAINKSKFIGDFVSKSILFTKECFKPINKNDPLPNYITPTSLNLFLQNDLNDDFMAERIKERPIAFADLFKNVQKHDLYNIERLLIKTYLSFDVNEKQEER